METKKCTKCGEIKPIKNFFLKKKDENKRHSQCSFCQREGKRKYARKNIEKIKQHKKDRDILVRKKFYDHLETVSCVDCNNNDPRVIEFDHINSKDKLKPVANMIRGGYSWDKIMKEINKCEPRCANCHRIKTGDQNGSFRNKYFNTTKTIVR